MVILKSSQNKEAAHAFINFILDPANHAWVAENILYKVPNKAAMEQVGRRARGDLPEHGDDAGRPPRRARPSSTSVRTA